MPDPVGPFADLEALVAAGLLRELPGSAATRFAVDGGESPKSG